MRGYDTRGRRVCFAVLNPKKRGPWRSSFNDPTGNPKPQIAPDRAARRAGEFEQTADRHVEAVDDGAYDFELFSRCATLAPLWYGMRYGRGGLEQCCDVQSRTQRISK